MSEVVLGSLIAALGAIVVAFITLYQHRAAEREKAEREDTEQKLQHSEALFNEYRHLLGELRTELAREREDSERVRGERDKLRARVTAAERQVEQWIESRDKGDGRP